MVGAYYLFGVLLVFGYVQCDVVFQPSEPAFIEDIRAQSGSRIVGGLPAAPGQFPYQASLRLVSTIGGVSGCGGIIIQNDWILSAAHCFVNRITYVVRLGMTNLTLPLYMVETDRKFIHPEYNEAIGGVQTHDIALVQLKWAIPYGPTIQPIRLQNSVQKYINYEGVRLTASGFGRTDDLINGGLPSDKLLWTYLRGISNEECLRWYPNSQTIREQTVCAQYYNHTSQSICTGDSGGPLTVIDYDGKPTVIGVVSFGAAIGCNTPNPQGYVRPGFYLDWIKGLIGVDLDWSQESEIQPVHLPAKIEVVNQ